MKNSKKSSVLEEDLKKEGIVAEKDSFLEGDEHEESKEEFSEEISSGEKDEDVYTEEGREKLVEDDEISAQEEGFMETVEKSKKKHKHH